MDDREIIDLFTSRSEKAINELAERYGPICKQVASNILTDKRDVEECLNDTWFGVWNTIPPQHPDVLSAYVVRIVKNIAINKRRYMTAKRRNSYMETSLEELEECLPDTYAGKDGDGPEIRRVLDQFLDNLNPENRVVFVKRYWFSESLKSIAKEVGLSEGNVKVRLVRLRRQLGALLKSEGVYL